MTRISSSCVMAVASVVALMLVMAHVATAAPAAPGAFAMKDVIPDDSPKVYIRGRPIPLPSLETVLGQDFDVSVVTESYGVFNATLRVRSSITFPERLHGELIPYGDVAQSPAGSAKTLPHFNRLRTTVDDQYSEIPLASGVMPKPKERPTLLVFDMMLQHPGSPQGSISVYHLPAEEAALQKAQESLQEGTLGATTVATFEFKPEPSSMTTPPLRTIAQLARTASNAFLRYAEAAAPVAGADPEAPAGPSTQGDFAFRLLSEHEFWCQLRLPPAPQADGNPATVRLENVWLYGYTAPNRAVLNREADRPWYSKYSVFFLGGMAFMVQIISGISDGWKKSNAEKAYRDGEAVADAPAPPAVKQDKKKH